MLPFPYLFLLLLPQTPRKIDEIHINSSFVHSYSGSKNNNVYKKYKTKVG